MLKRTANLWSLPMYTAKLVAWACASCTAVTSEDITCLPGCV